MPRRLSVSILAVLVLATTAGAAGAQTVTSRYDAMFRKYSKRFFGPAFDWRFFKAQAMAESGLDAAARSWVGARGIMQLMPSTFKEVKSKNPELGDMNDPEWNIAAGVYHDRQLYREWMKDAAVGHRKQFTLGSYNAGRTTLLRAQKVAQERALDHRAWPSIEIIAPQVPRWRYEETLNYVAKVEDTLARMDQSGRLR